MVVSRYLRLGLILSCVTGLMVMPGGAIIVPAAMAHQTVTPISQAEVLFKQGFTAYQNQQIEAAITAWQRALSLYQQENATYPQSVVLNFLAAAHISLGQMRLAEQYLQQALPLVQQTTDLALQAQILGNLGIIHRSQGRYVQAVDVYQQSLALMRQLGDRNGEAHILGLLGNAYESLGEYETAIKWHQQSLEISQIQENWLTETTALANLGSLQATLGNYGQAIILYRRSQQISRTHDDLDGVAVVSHNLGAAHHALGDLDEAMTFYQQSLEMAQILQNSRLEGEVLGNLGLIYSDLGNLDQALAYIDRSLSIATNINEPRAMATAFNNLGHTFFAAGQLDKAATHLYSAINILESLRPGLTDNFNLSVFDTQVLPYNLLQQILVAQGKTEAALEVAERGRAQAFIELLAGRLTPSQLVDSDPVLTIEKIRQIAKEQQATLVEYTLIPNDSFKFQGKQRGTPDQLYIWVVQQTGEVDFRQVDLKPLQQDKGLSIAKLVESSRDRSGIRGLSEPGSNRSLAIRPGDQVRREGDSQDWAPYDVIAIDPRARTVTLSHPDFMLPNPVVPLSEVYKVNGSAFAPVLKQRQHWQDLHQLLIEPIEDLLPSDPNARVVFVPQEQLFLVPFPALQAKDGSDLIEHHTILTAPAIQVLGLTSVKDNESAQTASPPLVVGNPSPMPESLPPLPHAGTEADGVAELLSTSPLIGDAATETAIKQQLSTASLIHLATHGFFNEANPLQGSLAFAPTDSQDGLLTAEEILDQSLQADLVVLSACDTGRGQITGDGVIGLSRSFLAAGADNVMVSLWQVPDDATAQLMIEFYRQRQQLDNAQALRQAMLATREQYKDPVAWAAFTLIGAIE